MHEHSFSLNNLDDMIPWEREIYISLVEDYVRKANEENKKNG
jgi:hypothetical protein